MMEMKYETLRTAETHIMEAYLYPKALDKNSGLADKNSILQFIMQPI